MSSESSFPYNGPLSTYTEWDALLYDLTAGIALSIDRVRADIAREPSKLIAGAIVAYLALRLRGE